MRKSSERQAYKSSNRLVWWGCKFVFRRAAAILGARVRGSSLPKESGLLWLCCLPEAWEHPLYKEGRMEKECVESVWVAPRSPARSLALYTGWWQLQRIFIKGLRMST